MKYLITTFILLFTINSSLSDEGLWQRLESVGSCDSTMDSATIYMQEKDCVKDHGTCAHLTVNCHYAKLVTQEIDDLEKPIECEGQQLLTNSICYEKKTIYVTEIDGAKKLAYDAQVIQTRRLQLQKEKAECGDQVVKMADSMFIDDNNIDPAKQDLTLERTKEVRQDLKDGILDRALRFANNVEIEGTLLSSYQKQYLISKIEECISKFQ